MPTNDINKVMQGLSQKKDSYVRYVNDEVITWCSGCGNYQIQNALKRSLTLEGYTADKVLMSFDIGCNGNGSDKIAMNTFHGLHGRALPLAAGAAMGNTDLKVIASAGDGGTMSEGINHLVHCVRSEYPITFILHNNHNYGLTTGQCSACTLPGRPMNGSPDGQLLEPMNPSEFVLNLNPSFVARTFSGDVKHMTKMFRKALNHKGFAFVEVLQTCPTYNKVTPQEWYWERVKYLEDIKGWKADDLEKAKKYIKDFKKNVYLGVFYENKNVVPYVNKLPYLSDYKGNPANEVKHFDVSKLIKGFE